jgi:uncharacterized linocin/CFP29 family protein
MSSNTANFSTNDEIDLSAPWAYGEDYWFLNKEEKKQVAANYLATNQSTLERDEYETLSDRIISTYKDELVGINDLQNAGLTRNISLATQVDLWQTLSEVTEAEASMDGEAQGENDSVEYTTQGAPVPIYFKDYRIPQRQLMTSRRMNNDLRTDNAGEMSRAVARLMDQILFQGWEPAVDTARGDSWELYGYTSTEVSASVSGSDFGTADNIRDVFVETIDTLDDNNQNPAGDGYWTYISKNQYQQYRSAIDPDGDGNDTVRERIEDEFDAELGMVKSVPDYVLPDGEMVMVNPTADVVEYAQAEDMQTIEWTSGSGMSNFYKIMAAGAPEIKTDSKGQVGVAHVTGI